jgi:hypothetical protein
MATNAQAGSSLPVPLTVAQAATVNQSIVTANSRFTINSVASCSGGRLATSPPQAREAIPSIQHGETGVMPHRPTSIEKPRASNCRSDNDSALLDRTAVCNREPRRSSPDEADAAFGACVDPTGNTCPRSHFKPCRATVWRRPSRRQRWWWRPHPAQWAPPQVPLGRQRRTQLQHPSVTPCPVRNQSASHLQRLPGLWPHYHSRG